MSHTMPETQFDDWNNSKKKTHYKENNIRGKASSAAMILQLKTFDKKRLMTRIGMLNKEDFEKVVEKTRNLFIPPTK